MIRIITRLHYRRGISSHYPVHLTHTIASPRTVAVHYTPAGEISSLS